MVRDDPLVADELPIYREEVLTIMGALADLIVGVDEIKAFLFGEGDEEAEADEP
jgi:hypothetical protein